ncbi:pyridoxal-dependent decarboxylase domain protein [Aspergillus terreus]|uniref:Pyridoxal-dependent decarboxylase domain protein n=1 Tax=Aspergillus terreus TaxID=33178 RepID=A0A5M3YT14_ASPTE|nr:hypothetical protein ATETN484_0002038800 [Aspergillus terreus]GFF15244.1 pyridoxal-dependent decarboxylase domain protein [Aspergillus terreus]
MASHTPEGISAFFLGPHAENMDFFKQAITSILDELQSARLRYAHTHKDSAMITDETKSSHDFQETTERLSVVIRNGVQMLSRHSIPFWSPRYGAHMCTDLAMPAMLGYFMGMIWNPNNVTTEVSPWTTRIEREVGEQFCELFGYNLDSENGPVGWGHITSGGTVANIEAMWVARNLKFFPLALRRAIDEGKLGFLKDIFSIETCEGVVKRVSDMSVWELLNLRSETLLDIPRVLLKGYKLPKEFLDEVLWQYNIQCTGKEELERYFGIDKTSRFVLAKTHHYSWMKGAAILGIGSNHVVGIDIDTRARIDLEALENHLQDCLDNHQPVYTVVPIIGTTEEGSVDRLAEIIAMRKRFQAKGLSFLIHADAAWGGYFACMVPSHYPKGTPHGLNLKPETAEDLAALKYADSITVDPHKSGYIPYPAGCLVYRDGRMKNLVSWTSPYLSQGSDGGMGIYGLEGSKPGAAAMACWLAHEAIGLNYDGYGSILRQVSFNRAMQSAVWATFSKPRDSFILVPFEMLPSETKDNFMPHDLEKDKLRIRKEILGKTYDDIAAADVWKPKHKRTMPFLRQLGSDLNINTFAINWKHRNGEINRDTHLANQLMRRVVKRLSVNSPDQDPSKIPLYLTSTEFSVERYGTCALKFKQRLQLRPNHEDLFVLRNVVMSPFAAQGAQFQNMMDTFRQIVEEEVGECRRLYDH